MAEAVDPTNDVLGKLTAPSRRKADILAASDLSEAEIDDLVAYLMALE
jgi:hypothetical protein